MLTFPSLTEHGYNSSSRVFYNSCFWAVLGLAPVGYFFPLQLIWFSLFFVCRVILDCTLDTLNIRAWDFGLESSGECWFCCFSRRSSLPYGSDLKLCLTCRGWWLWHCFQLCGPLLWVRSGHTQFGIRVGLGVGMGFPPPPALYLFFSQDFSSHSPFSRCSHSLFLWPDRCFLCVYGEATMQFVWLGLLVE